MRHSRFGLVAATALALALPAGASATGGGLDASPAPAKAPAKAKSPKSPSDAFGSEVAVDWMELLYDIVRDEKLAPPPASRVYGNASVSLYETVVAGARKNRSLGGQLNDLPEPAPLAFDVHWPAAANAAMARTIRGLLPAATPATLAAISALEQSYAAQFQAELSPGLYADSVAHGEMTADDVLAWTATDGFAGFNNCPYVPPVGPGLWEPTPPGFAAALQPCWGDIRPMVLTEATECAAPIPPVYSTDPGSELYQLAQEVVDVKANLTPEQETIARYWADGPVATGTPAGHWMAIASQVAVNDGLSLMRAAEAYARVGLSVNDAFISCWAEKYNYNLLRPVTYIQDFIDPAWLSLLTTPNFPEHTSGHSTQSGSSSEVLARMFGKKYAFTDMTHTNHNLMPPQVPRSFASFREAAEEAAVSRLYGGIHYRSGNDGGLAQGRCIGKAINQRIKFR